jgi:hypothetical protein
MKTLASVLILSVLVAGAAQAEGTIGLYGDTGSGLSRTMDSMILTPFDVVALMEDVLIGAGAEFVMTELATEYPGVLKIGTQKINNTPLDLGDNARGEYLIAFGECIWAPTEIVRVTYLDVGGFIPGDVVLQLRGFEPGDSQPSTFNGRAGFIDCAHLGSNKHLFGLTNPGLITGSGAYVPPGGMVVNATQPVVEEDTSTWFSLDFAPATLNLANNGRTVQVELTENASRTLGEIDLESLELMGIPAIANSIRIDESVTPPTLKAKFPRGGVADMLLVGMNVEVTLTGETSDGSVFTATDEIRVIDPKNASHARTAESIAAGSVISVEWRAIFHDQQTTYDGYISVDAGTTWSRVFKNVTGTNSYAWTLDASLVGEAQVIVEGRTSQGGIHHAMTSEFTIGLAIGASNDADTASTFSVSASPNPFNPNTTVYFSLPVAGHAELVVYDLAGRKVKTLASGFMQEGEHQSPWNGRDDSGRQVASGTYIYMLRAGTHVETNRMVLLK